MTTERSLKRLTPLEGHIMDVLWEQAPTTVRQVQERLQPTKPMAYNTVLTVMRVLRDKGHLRSERQGRADVYRPTVSREQMGKRSLGEVMQLFFAGSAKNLVSKLLDSEEISEEEIAEIRREIDKRIGA